MVLNLWKKHKYNIRWLFEFKNEDNYFFDVTFAISGVDDLNIGDSIVYMLLAYPCDSELTEEDYVELFEVYINYALTIPFYEYGS